MAERIVTRVYARAHASVCESEIRMAKCSCECNLVTFWGFGDYVFAKDKDVILLIEIKLRVHKNNGIYWREWQPKQVGDKAGTRNHWDDRTNSNECHGASDLHRTFLGIHQRDRSGWSVQAEVTTGL